MRGLQKAHKVGVLVPGLYMTELEAGTLYMERIQGCSLKDALLAQQLSEAGVVSAAHLHVTAWQTLTASLPWPHAQAWTHVEGSSVSTHVHVQSEAP